MQVVTTTVDVPFPQSPHGVVRCLVTRPVRPVDDDGAPSGRASRFPWVLHFADIFGHSPSHRRVQERLAGHGYVVVSPEPWSYFHPPGTVYDFDADRDAAIDAQDRAVCAREDAARRAIIAAVEAGTFDDVAGPLIDAANRLALGFCYGGHCAFRAALDDGTRATACFYGTGIHADRLGGGEARSLEEARKITGEVLLVWGRRDPHVPPEGRALIHRVLDDVGVRFETRLYDAEHAFVRDVGPRFDPAATDAAFAATLALFARATR